MLLYALDLFHHPGQKQLTFLYFATTTTAGSSRFLTTFTAMLNVCRSLIWRYHTTCCPRARASRIRLRPEKMLKIPSRIKTTVKSVRVRGSFIAGHTFPK